MALRLRRLALDPSLSEGCASAALTRLLERAGVPAHVLKGASVATGFENRFRTARLDPVDPEVVQEGVMKLWLKMPGTRCLSPPRPPRLTPGIPQRDSQEFTPPWEILGGQIQPVHGAKVWLSMEISS